MQRRKFIAGVGSIAAGAAAVTGTGAFTSAEAERSVSMSVANDTNAYVGLKATNNANANEYVNSNDGTLEISIGNNDEGAGINKEAVTEFAELFEVTNQGTQQVFWWISYDPEDGQKGFPNVEGTPGDQQNPSGLQDLEFFVADDDQIINFPEGQSANGSGLSPGSSDTVGLRIDTRGYPNLEANEPLFDGTVTINMAGLE
ncbi:hypothetical protein GCM10027355_36460 [Haloplanus salinarum]|jgi:hypothetical protein|uniref:hypothetical protein n=1 Tax=Haloplanus salinarum TaxID=1912324 RepID=UPI003B433000